MLLAPGQSCASHQATPVCDARSVDYALRVAALAFFGNGKPVTNATHFARYADSSDASSGCFIKA